MIDNVDFFTFLQKCFYIIIYENYMDIHPCFNFYVKSESKLFNL